MIPFYRKLKEDSVKGIADSQKKTGPERVDCSSEYEKKWLGRVKAILEREVQRLDRMCRACIVCRD